MSSLMNLRALTRARVLGRVRGLMRRDQRREGRHTAGRRWRHALRRPVVVAPVAIGLLGAVAVTSWIAGWSPDPPTPAPVAGPDGVVALPRMAFASAHRREIIYREAGDDGADTFWSSRDEYEVAEQPAGSHNRLVYVRHQQRPGVASDLAGQIWYQSSPGSKPVEVGTEVDGVPVPVAEPDISPDGAHIAYSALHDGHWEIWVISTRPGSTAKQLTHENATATWPRWAPRGDTIAFVSTRDDPAGDIYTIPASGGASPTRITNSPAADTQPAWSPRGDRLAFTTSRWHTTTDIAVVLATGGTVIRLTPGSQPVWSPSGRRIYYANVPVNADGRAVSPNTQLYWVDVTDPARSDPTPTQVPVEAYQFSAGGVRHPAFRDDDETMDLVLEVDVNWPGEGDPPLDVWSMGLDGSDLTNLTQSPTPSERAPAYSWDGMRIAFQEERFEESGALFGTGITIANRDGTDRQPLTPGEREFDSDPVWSPDGTKIAFSRYTWASESTDKQILIVNVADGMRATPVAVPCDGVWCDDAEPAWSPDGTKIAFTRAWGAHVDRQRTGLDSAPRRDYRPQLSGRRSVPIPGKDYQQAGSFGGWASELWTVDVNRDGTIGRRRFVGATDYPPVSPGTGRYPSTYRSPAWSPIRVNGQYPLVYVQDSRYLMRIQPDGTGQQVLFDPGDMVEGALSDLADPAYSPDGGTIVFDARIILGFYGGPYYSDADLFAIPAEGGTPRLVVSKPGDDVEPTFEYTSDLGVAIGAAPSSISVGMSSTVTATVVNRGWSPAPNTVAKLAIPAGMRATALRSGAGTCTLSTLTCDLGDLAVGARATITLEVTAQRTGIQEVTVRATSDRYDPDPSDNTGSTSVIVGEQADVAVSVSVAPQPGYVGGDRIVVTYVITNRGGHDATNVRLSTTLPRELPIVGVQLTPSGSGRSCSSPFTGCSLGTIPQLGSDGPGIVTVRVTLAPRVAVNTLATATVSADFDGDADNSRDSAAIRVLAPRLLITPTVGPPGFVPIVTGADFPAGAKVRLTWDRGITWRTRNLITVGADGTFRAPMLVFHKDVMGARVLQAKPDSGTPAGTAFGPVEVDFVVVQGQDQPDEWLDRR